MDLALNLVVLKISTEFRVYEDKDGMLGRNLLEACNIGRLTMSLRLVVHEHAGLCNVKLKLPIAVSFFVPVFLLTLLAEVFIPVYWK